MADLLFGDLGLISVPKRKERQFRLRDDFSLTDFTDSELRSRYRFGRESPMPLHKNKYTSSSGHRREQRLFKRSEAFMTKEGSLG